MGVRGLTSYIAKNAEKYLEPFELHDCDLVIDGDSLASNLYTWHSQCNSAFGGDYDQYFRCVVTFFGMLKQCNVKPYVLLDGGYEKKKLQTVRTRLRSKIGAVKHINPFRCIPLFPLMLREVFVEAVKTIGCPLMRCLFEADDEVSVLARKLNCPVLSYDSDFYIHNVKYIPSITLSFRVHKRKIPKKNRGKLTTGSEAVVYYYLDCCVYSISNLVRNELDHDMLPLLATLLGNDYINGCLFRKFYINVSLKNIGKKNSQQQRRIIGLLRWLKHETVHTAITKVLSRFEKDKRSWILSQIEAAMGGYNGENSRAFKFFDLDQGNGELSKGCFSGLSDIVIDSDEVYEDSDHTSEDSSSEPENDEDNEGDDGEEEEEIAAKSDEENEPLEGAYEAVETGSSFEPPDWILNRFLTAELPRFVVDLLHLRLYVNSPQIENFMLKDSNEIALPILRLIFTLLHYPEPYYFQYLTRVLRVSNVHYKKVESISLEGQFDPILTENVEIFKLIFDDFESKINVIMSLPENLRLFVLAMTYLSDKNSKISSPCLHSLLIAFLLLTKADEDIQPVTRDPNVLHKKYGSVIANLTKESKQISNKEAKVDDELYMATEINFASMVQSITTNDSVLFLRNVLPLFQISDKIREKHTDFSSTIVHTFAEFQAVIFNLNCLNTLLNEPFQRIVVSKVFNGTFLYNMYVNLRDRPNIEHYIRHYVFKDCERYYHLYTSILSVCKLVISCLRNTDKDRKAKTSRNYRRNRRKQKLKTVGSREVEIAENAFVDVEPDDCIGEAEVEFDDLNNKFTKLLNCSKTL